MDHTVSRGYAVPTGEPSEAFAVCGGGKESPELAESNEEKDECRGTEARADRNV